MRIHFIAIGGSVMHNLAIVLHKQGHIVTGSDDLIFEPSKSRLKQYNLLPPKIGWFPEKINTKIDIIIVGMHARSDNPELKKAMKLNLKIYSYPEYIYQNSKLKTRVVIGGSHGKTTITSMVMHVLRENNYNFDYLVGSRVQSFDTMVRLSSDAPVIILEGDEYFASAIDLRPKFHVYKPDIALISGIAWDHINVFNSFEVYLKQFEEFINTITDNGVLIYFAHDKYVQKIIKNNPRNDIQTIAYTTHDYKIRQRETYLVVEQNKEIRIKIFGQHNLNNISGAKLICNQLGIHNRDFYRAISSFKGADRRLELIGENRNTKIFFDFAHSPSKLVATINAVKTQFPDQTLLACIELHTYSSLNKKFLTHYQGTMDKADYAFVFYDPQAVEHKRLPKITPQQIIEAFKRSDLHVFTDAKNLFDELLNFKFKKKIYLLMSSGNFGGYNIYDFAKKLL